MTHVPPDLRPALCCAAQAPGEAEDGSPYGQHQLQLKQLVESTSQAILTMALLTMAILTMATLTLATLTLATLTVAVLTMAILTVAIP